MCGIIGYQGKNQASKVLIDGLKALEYRGYDSAGISVIKDGNLLRARAEGKLINLIKKIDHKDWSSSIGIGHTRWATHGIPSESNAHPHQIHNISIVHNGIIENNVQLRNIVKNKVKLSSDTDSELIAALIHLNMKDNLLDSVFSVLPQLKGAYAVLVMCNKEPNTLIAFKHGPPLVIGIGNGESVIASDVSAIVPYTRKVLYLEDNEVLEIKNNKYKLFDIDRSKKKFHPISINIDFEQGKKHGYSHYMLKEIFDQPSSIQRALLPFLNIKNKTVDLPNLGFGIDFIDFVNSSKSNSDDTYEILKNVDRIFIVSCGTSYHAGLIGKYMIEHLAQIPVEVELSSEFRYRKSLVPKNSLFIFISQSGETADSIAALEIAKKSGAKTLSICNTPGSTLDRRSDGRIHMSAGPEISVASTKAFTCSLAIINALAFCIGKLKNKNIINEKEVFDSLVMLPSQVETALGLDKTIKQIANSLKKFQFLFIGRGVSYPVALEGALKLKELAYIQSEGYAAGEMKHGPIALIDKKTAIVVIAPSDHVYEKTISNLEEAKARNANIISILNSDDKHVKKLSMHSICVPNNMFSSILSVIPLQLMSFHIANALGNDVDQPRNLAKSVTVE